MSETVIEVRNLRKVYRDVIALDNVSFKVNAGEVFAYLGPNGSGKTTTVEILVGLRRPTSGEAKVAGLDVVKEASKLKRVVGILPQDFTALDRLTVEENIKLFRSLYDSGPSVDELIELVGLQEKRRAKFYELSGGLKQRVGIAAALAGDPQIVFLDEPTTGLDPAARRDTWEVIRELKRRGKTVFLTTHYMEEAQELADRVAIIVKGRIVALGTPEELIREHGGPFKLYIKGLDRLGTRIEDAKKVGEYVIVEGDLKKLLRLAADILESGVKGVNVELKPPTLEEVFLRLTGYRMTEEGEIA